MSEFKRITYKNRYGRWVVDFHGLDGRVIKQLHGEEIDRLAAYEDIGSPEEFASLRAQLAESRAREQAAVKERDEIQELFRGDCDKCKHFDAPCGSRRPDGRVVGFCGQLKPDCWKWGGLQDAKGEAR